MSITENNKLTLLQDLLSKHMTDNSGNIAEYEQIKRIVQKLTGNDNLADENLLHLMPEIYNYSLQGKIAQNIPEHIMSNKQNIVAWISAIETTTLNY